MPADDAPNGSRPILAVVGGSALIIAGVALMLARPLWNDTGIWRPVLVATVLGLVALGARVIASTRTRASSD